MNKTTRRRFTREKLIGVLFGTAVFSLCACFMWLCGCSCAGDYTPSELDGLNSANVVLDFEKNKLDFALGMKVDSSDIIVRCGGVAGDGVNSVKITSDDIKSGRVTHTDFDTSTVGNRTVTVSLMGKDFPIEYSVGEYRLNLYLDEEEKVYRSLDQDDMGARLTDDLTLVCGVNLSDYNYALDESVINTDEGLKFCGWYDVGRNAYTGDCYLPAPVVGNQSVLNLYAGFLTDSELSAFDIRYRNGQKEFSGYKGGSISDGVLKIPESVTTVDFKTIVGGEELPYSAVEFPSTANLSLPLSERISSPSITELRVDEGHKTFSCYDGAIYNKSLTTLYYMPSGKKEAQFAPKLATIGYYACADSALTRVTLPDTVRALENYCFAYSSLFEVFGLNKDISVMSTAFYRTPYEDGGMVRDDEYSALYAEVRDGDNKVIGYDLRRVDDKNITSFVALPDTLSVSGDAFINCKKLITVDLGDKAESIGKSAFSGCEKLQIIKGLGSLKEAGAAVFAGCASLESIALPDLKFVNGTAAYPHTLPNEMFYGCSALKQIDISPKTQTIGTGAFRDCEKLTSFPFDALSSLTSIMSNAFSGSGVSSAKFPATLTSIGSYCFRNSKLAEVDFSGCDNLTEFIAGLKDTSATYIFENTRLTRVTLPKNLKSIPGTCFSKCKLLTEVTGGEQVEWIGAQAFKDCASLSVFDFGKMTVLQRIGGSAFNNSALKSVTLPDSVQSVGAQTFGACGALTDFHLGAGVVTFGTYVLTGNDFTSRNPVFLNTVNLREITVSEENRYYSAVDGVLYGSRIGNTDYGKGSVLVCVPAQYPHESFTPLNSVKYVLPYAVINQSVLEEVTLNDGAINIGTAAFYASKSLKSLAISASVEHIGANVVASCPNVSEIFIAKDNKNYASSDDGHLVYKISGDRELILAIGAEGEVVIEEGTKVIASGVFMESDITGVKLPDSVERIGSKAFYGCLYLSSVEIGSGLEYFDSDAFGELLSLESVQVSENNRNFKVKGGCLYSKDGKTLYLVPASNGIKTLDLEGVETVSDWAAGYHLTLESVIMHEGLRTIGERAFYECRGISSLRFPESLRSIGRWAFSFDSAINPGDKNELRKCDTLKYIILDCTDIALDSTVFEGQYGIEKIYLTFSVFSDVSTLMIRAGDYLANGCPMGGGGGFYNNVQRCLYSKNNDALLPVNGYSWWHYDDNGDPVLWE